ncbi:MAG: hypothetical protein LBG06_00435 [Deltaproteobacteria bacterium]|jgi:hypothetical protein|nr:hypothetical protein [Deltaproteobacteria bacterium]
MPHDDDMLANLIPHLQGWWGALSAALCLAGLAIVVCGVASLARGAACGRARPWAAAAFAVGAGILLVNLPGFLDSLAQSVFGHASVQGLSYRPPEHPARHYVQFAVHLLALVGLAGVGRGLLLLRDSPERPGQLGRALVHIAGGTLCVNFVPTLRILGRSLGQDVASVIAAITG